jgi:hypothetical protein
MRHGELKRSVKIMLRRSAGIYRRYLQKPNHSLFGLGHDVETCILEEASISISVLCCLLETGRYSRWTYKWRLAA